MEHRIDGEPDDPGQRLCVEEDDDAGVTQTHGYGRVGQQAARRSSSLSTARVAAFRNLAIGALKTLGAGYIAKAIRVIRDEPERGLPVLGITNTPDASGT